MCQDAPSHAYVACPRVLFHLGVCLVVLACTASSCFQGERDSERAALARVQEYLRKEKEEVR